MKMTNYQWLALLVQRSRFLTDEEKVNFLSYFAFANDQDLCVIVSLIKRTPSNLRLLYKNLKEKQHAVSSKDQTAWQRVVQEEAEELEKIAAF